MQLPSSTVSGVGVFFFQAEDGIRDLTVTGVQTCALPIYIEQELSKRMNIPVFHDDQHGTAIISSAALLNGLELVDKQIGNVKIAVSGAGAAAKIGRASCRERV